MLKSVNKMHVLLILGPLYATAAFVLGATVTTGIFIFHVAVVPLIFKYSERFRRGLIFANFDCGVLGHNPTMLAQCRLEAANDRYHKCDDIFRDLEFNVLAEPQIQWPLNTDFEQPSLSGINGARNLSIEYHSKIDKCPVKIGVWHILPQEVYERLIDHFEPNADKEELHKLLDEELAKSDHPVVLYCHGNSNNRATHHRIKLYQFFQKMGFHTIAFDYRGYGDSTKIKPTEKGIVEDSLMVYKWMNSQANQPPFVWGHSLGTGVSSHLVGNLKELCSQLLERQEPLPLPKGLILESPFNNLADEVAEHPLSKLVTWLPYYDTTFVEPFRVSEGYTFKSDEYLRNVTTLPILILHARDDIIVPYVVGLKLYKTIKESRESGGAAVELHAFDSRESLGHKWICEASDLPNIIGEFV